MGAEKSSQELVIKGQEEEMLVGRPQVSKNAHWPFTVQFIQRWIACQEINGFKPKYITHFWGKGGAFVWLKYWSWLFE